MNGINLLIVDDNAAFVDQVVARLKSESATISWKVDCRDLMERIGYLLPDIVILDTNTPGMNPMVVSGSIRSHYPMIKIIVLSGPDDFKDAIPDNLQDDVDYVKKPIKIDELVKKIKKNHRNQRDG